MKRLVTVVVVMAVLLVGAPWVIGNIAEDRVDRGLDALVKAAPYLGIVEKKYTRGWFRSEQEVTFEVLGDALRPLGGPRFTVRNEILHGPVLGSSGLGLARINSKPVMDAATRAELVKLFGTDEPLRVSTRFGFLGGATTSLTSDAVEVHAGEGGTMSWDDLAIDIAYPADFDSVTVTGDWPRFEARDPRRHSVLVMKDLELDMDSERVQGHLYRTDGEFSIDELTIASDGDAPTTLEDLALEVDTRIDDGFMSIATRLGSGRVHGGLLKSQGIELSALHYDFTLRRLHVETLARIADGIAESYRRPEAAASLTDQAFGLLKHDPELVVDRIGFETKDGAAYLTGVIGLKGATEKDVRMGALSLIPRLDADLRFRAPRKLIESLPGGRESLSGAIEAGLAGIEGADVASRVEFRAGELKINGKVQGIPGLGAPPPGPE